jgi:hypothetical protein
MVEKGAVPIVHDGVAARLRTRVEICDIPFQNRDVGIKFAAELKDSG